MSIRSTIFATAFVVATFDADGLETSRQSDSGLGCEADAVD
jgi:hypothetical protein